MRKNNTQSLGIGLVIITVGLLFLASNLGYISKDIFRYIFSWYGWTLYVGPIMMFRKESRVLGSIFLGVGLIVLFGDLGFIPNLNVGQLWPLIIVAVGANFVYQAMSRKVPERPQIDSSGEFLNENHIFGGGEFNISNQNFKGGKVVCVFGGGNYNLSQSKLSPGDNNVLDVSCVFGGASFVVPSDWNVQISVTSIFGGFQDNRKVMTPTSSDKSKTLFITGLCLFGGGDVKSYS